MIGRGKQRLWPGWGGWWGGRSGKRTGVAGLLLRLKDLVPKAPQFFKKKCPDICTVKMIAAAWGSLLIHISPPPPPRPDPAARSPFGWSVRSPSPEPCRGGGAVRERGSPDLPRAQNFFLPPHVQCVPVALMTHSCVADV